MQTKIGIMGGTFDPIHNGHLVIAEAARHEYALDKVLFIPAGEPPHKESYLITNAEDRYNMVELAIEGNEKFEISPIEIQRPGPSYTVDTLSQLKNIYKESEFFIITGADAIVELLTWKETGRLASLCSFIAATRPGFDLKRLNDELKAFPQNLKRKIVAMEVPGMAISSTDIRNRRGENKPISYLLPEKVEKYIFQENLYK